MSFLFFRSIARQAKQIPKLNRYFRHTSIYKLNDANFVRLASTSTDNLNLDIPTLPEPFDDEISPLLNTNKDKVNSNQMSLNNSNKLFLLGDCIKRKDFQKADNVLKDILEDINLPTLGYELYNTYLPNSFNSYFQSFIKNNPITINNSTQYIENLLYLSTSDPASSISIYTKLITFDKITINNNMHNYICSSFTPFYPPCAVAMYVYESACQSHIHISTNIIHRYFTQLCKVLSNNQTFYIALNIKNILEKYNHEMSIKTQELLLDQFCKRKFHAAAFKQFDQLKLLIRPNINQYVQIIKAAIKENDYERVESYYEDATFNGIVKGEDTLLIPLSYIYSVQGRTNEILDIINKIKTEKPDRVLPVDFYLNLLRSYSYNKDYENVKKIEEIIYSNYKLDNHILLTYIIIMSEYLNHTYFDQVIMNLYNNPDYCYLLAKENVFYRILIFAAMNEEWKLYNKYLTMMSRLNVILHSTFYIKILDVCLNVERYDLVLKYGNIFRKYIQQGSDRHSLDYLFRQAKYHLNK